jgi:hypothetical protein
MSESSASSGHVADGRGDSRGVDDGDPTMRHAELSESAGRISVLPEKASDPRGPTRRHVWRHLERPCLQIGVGYESGATLRGADRVMLVHTCQVRGGQVAGGPMMHRRRAQIGSAMDYCRIRGYSVRVAGNTAQMRGSFMGSHSEGCRGGEIGGRVRCERKRGGVNVCAG